MKSSLCFFSNLFTVVVRSCTLFFKVVGEADCLVLDLALTLDLLLLSLLDLLNPLSLLLSLDALLLDSLSLVRDLEFLPRLLREGDLIRLSDTVLGEPLHHLLGEGDLLRLSDTVLEEPLPRLLGETLPLSPSRPC